MVTILAGNECTGKSTCFAHLRDMVEFTQAVDCLFVKESHTNSELEKLGRVSYARELVASNQTALFDRATMLDDLVYNPITDNKQSQLINEQTKEWYVDTLKQCQIIFFECSLDTIKQRLSQRGDEYIDESQLEQIQQGYEAIFEQYGLEPIRINVDGLSEKEVTRKVMEVLRW